MNKQYLLMADDITMAYLGKVMPGLRYLEIKGMPLKDNNEVLAVVTPFPETTVDQSEKPLDMINNTPEGQ